MTRTAETVEARRVGGPRTLLGPGQRRVDGRGSTCAQPLPGDTPTHEFSAALVRAKLLA